MTPGAHCTPRSPGPRRFAAASPPVLLAAGATGMPALDYTHTVSSTRWQTACVCPCLCIQVCRCVRTVPVRVCGPGRVTEKRPRIAPVQNLKGSGAAISRASRRSIGHSHASLSDRDGGMLTAASHRRGRPGAPVAAAWPAPGCTVSIREKS